MNNIKKFVDFVNESIVTEKYNKSDINLIHGFYGTISNSLGKKLAKSLFYDGIKDLMKNHDLTEVQALDVLNSRMGRKAGDEIVDKRAKTAIEGLQTYYANDLSQEIKKVHHK